MAEEHLRAGGIEPSPGLRFRWVENLEDSMWKSVIVEIERRGEQWIVTRLDRKGEPQENPGFFAL